MAKHDPCPLCEETDFTWGSIITGNRFRFAASGWFFEWGQGIDARRCNTCGNVQFFTEIPWSKDKSKRKRGEY